MHLIAGRYGGDWHDNAVSRLIDYDVIKDRKVTSLV